MVIKNMGLKIVITVLTLAIVVLVLSFSPRSGNAYDPVLTNTGTLNFPSTAAGLSSELTITVTGAATGDCVQLGVPAGSMPTTGGFMAYVSATNTVTVRFFNTDVLSALDPASGTFKVIIRKN